MSRNDSSARRGQAAEQTKKMPEKSTFLAFSTSLHKILAESLSCIKSHTISVFPSPSHTDRSPAPPFPEEGCRHTPLPDALNNCFPVLQMQKGAFGPL